MKNKYLLIPIIIFFLLMSFCNPAPEVKEVDTTDIDIFSHPVQELTDEIDPIILTLDEGVFTILPIATYSISAQVISSKSYSSGWNAKIAPVDLALAWGELADPTIQNMIEFSQRNRWYFYRYPQSFPKSKQFIIEQSANTHTIPATENIKRALKHIIIGDNVKIEGFLVKINGQKNGRKYWWKSSLSRKDTGNNSCELLYVLELRVNNNIY